MVRPLVFLLSSLFFLVSCNQNELGKAMADETTLPSSNGGRLDVIVVAEESLWQDKAGEVFRKYFARSQDGLPQSEAILSLKQVTPKQFNNLLQRARNVIILNIGPEKVVNEQNQYAKPQRYITLSAPDQDALADLIKKEHEHLITDIHDGEMYYLQKRVTAKWQKNSSTLEKRGVSMKIPPGFERTVEQPDLLVFWNKTLKTQQGIIIHFEPIPDEEMAIGSRIIPLRDSLTQLHVPGDNDGSYMIAEDYIPPVFTNMTIDDQFAIETRGLWRTEGDFMGGAFISYTIYDEIHHQKITLDAFLYAPEVNKRNFVLELEAILRTIEIKD